MMFLKYGFAIQFKSLPILLGALLLSSVSSVGHTQENDGIQVETFDAEYYNQYAPRNAYDMLLRTPGFQIIAADSKRGLGQGGANILINGNRLAGKNSDPIEQLRRIPAENVTRIEFVDGSRSGVPGLTGRVANLITIRSGLSGNWSWSPAFRNYVEPNWGRADISVSGSGDNFEYGISVSNTSNRLGSRGPETRRNTNGEVIEIVDEQFNGAAFGPTISGNLVWKPDTETRANVEAKYSDFNINDRELSQQRPGGETGPAQSAFFFGLDRRQGEISSDITWPMMKGKIKLLGFYSFLDDTENSVIRRFDERGESNAERFELDLSTQEAILRAEYSLKTSERQSWQIAAEYARNDLMSNAALFSQSLDGLLDPVPLADPDTDVREDRYELTATYNWAPSDIWDLQVSLGAEYSELTQATTDSDKSRNFFRPKGFTSLTYAPNERFSVTSKLERKVGQLNFFDFTSAVSLEDDLDRTGNPELVPEQIWRAEIVGSKVLRDGHSLNLTVFAEEITDLVDRIAIGETGDGIGNIDRASKFGAEFKATLKGEAWGWKGVEFEFEYDQSQSKVDDPIEGFSRGLNNNPKQRFLLKVTHDIPNTSWAYGAQIDQTQFEPIYRTRTIDENFSEPFAVVFVEHKNIFGLKVRASVFNATDHAFTLDRAVYAGRRDRTNVIRQESREREFDPYLQFDISGRF